MSRALEHSEMEKQISLAMQSDGTREYMYPELYGTLYAFLLNEHEDIIEKALEMVLSRHTQKEGD